MPVGFLLRNFLVDGNKLEETADLLNCFYAKLQVSYVILADFNLRTSASI